MGLMGLMRLMGLMGPVPRAPLGNENSPLSITLRGL